MHTTRVTPTRASLRAALFAVMAVVFLSGPAVAASSSGGVALSDSLSRMAAGYYDTEPSVQDILNALGLNLSAENDALSDEWFCATKGVVGAGIIAEYSGAANETRLLWYPAGHPGDTLLVLPGVAGAGDSSMFVLSGNTSLAWAFESLGNAPWFSEAAFNQDGLAHVRAYPTPDPETFILFWEDLGWSADGDFNDLVVWVRLASPTPTMTLTDPAALGYATTPGSDICLGIDVDAENCAGQLVTVRMLEGVGQFTPVTGNGSISAQHCFTTSNEGLLTFVFEASLPDGRSDIDTLTLSVSETAHFATPEGTVISINKDNFFTICDPETVCVPYSVISTCGLTSVYTYAPGFINAANQSLCYYAQGGVEFCIPLIGQDQCGKKDSIMVCFIVEANEPATLTCPGTVDTTLCDIGFVSFPVSVSGGTPPVNITAVPPATYVPATGRVMVVVEHSGSFPVRTIVQNAECPPETCVTQVNAYVNTRPNIVGIPDSVIKVCGTGPFCFGPITATDAENNLTSFRLWGSPGTYTGTNWCFTPTSSTKLVRAVFRAADACGKTKYDTLLVEFNASPKPNITMNDISVGLCGPQVVCVPYSISNPGGLPLTYGLLSPGTLNTNDSTVCLSISAAGNFSVSVCVYDGCGGGDTATAVIHATLNVPPVLTCYTPSNAVRCPGSSVCVAYVANDANGGTITYEIHANGSIINRSGPSGVMDSICIPVTVGGPETVTIIATDGCGAKDTCTTSFAVTANTPPTVTVRDTTIFLCAAQQVCIPIVCNDVDNNLTSCSATGPKPGTYGGGQFCFTPDTAGVYKVTATATDVCGQTDQRIANVTVVLNRAPVLVVSDTNIDNVHDGDTVCVTVGANDPDGNLSGITAFDNYLSFDGQNLCLVGVLGEAVCARVIATDACGRKDTAIVCVFAQPTPTPKPDLPDSVFTRFCGAGNVCIDFSVGSSICAPITITALGGGTINLEDSTLCYFVSAPGVYQTGVIATDTCGAETAFVVINAVANHPPVIACPPSGEFLICHDTTICIPVTFSDADNNASGASATRGNLTQPAPGALQLCLPVDTAGWYSSRLYVFDSCGTSDTCDILVHIRRNAPPTVITPSDTTVVLCGPRQLCYLVTCSDPDGNLALCEQVGTGNGNWDGESLCFTPTITGNYQWVFRATDACGEFDLDTFKVNVQFNAPPFLTAPPTVEYQLCGPDTICFQYILVDPNGGPITVTSSLGQVRPDAKVCVYRTQPGTECLTLIATDSCGLSDTANVCLIGTLPPPPLVDAPDDLVRRVCGPGQVCFDVQVFHNKAWTGSVSPIGSFNQSDTSVCFNADTAGIYTLRVGATDVCGAYAADTILVEVLFNQPPVINGPSSATRIFCGPGPLCVGGFSASDPNGNLKHFILLAGIGTFDPGAGTLCFNADTTGTYCFQLTAQDSCNAAVVKNFCVTLVQNQKPALSITAPGSTLLYEEPTQVCLPLVATDPNSGQKRTLAKVSGAGVFSSVVSNSTINTQHCFLADTTGCYRFIFSATDSCGLFDQDTALVCVRIEPRDTMFQICIDNVQSLNGRNATVKIRGNKIMPMGGYDFLVCFDPTVMSFSQANVDSALIGWEYFTYRIGSATGCATCGSSVIRLIGIFDLNNGQGPPPAEKRVPKGPMFKLVFFVTPDRLFINQCAPIRFCFEDCGDNTISNPSGDTLYMAYTGVDPACLEGTEKGVPVPKIQFCDGSLCIIPPEDDRGDINLNGIANEIADAVLFSNFFIYGPSVWDPIFKENQILATDVNCDGLVLSIADLVYLIRIITHDADPVDCPDGTHKIAPVTHAARLTFERNAGTIEAWLESGDDIGGVFVNLSGAESALGRLAWNEDLGGLTPYLNQTKDGVRALLVAKQVGAKLPSGRRHLFTIPYDGSGDWGVIETQAASVEGEVVQLEVVTTGTNVPRSYELEQNHPNPFNAGTQIRFRLGEPGEWEVTIYNVLGQAVRKFKGADDAGYVTIEWDARSEDGKSVASGIYFTRLRAGEFSASKKMVLLK